MGKNNGEFAGGSRHLLRAGKIALATVLSSTATAGVVALGGRWAACRPSLELIQVPVPRRITGTSSAATPPVATRKPSLRVLHLSDLHLWDRQRWLIKFCRDLAQQRPDLVLLTGDNFADESGFAGLQEALEPLLEFPGIYVWGSNDFYSGRFKLPIHYFLPKRPTKPLSPDLPTAQFGQWLMDHGWIDLNNRTTTLNINGWQVAASGVEDPHISRDLPLQFPDTWSQADLRLGVTHAPYARILNAYAAAGAHLVVAGHTHGGQICLPNGKALTNNTDLPLEYSQGFFNWQNNYVYPMKPATPRGVVQPLPDLEALSREYRCGEKSKAASDPENAYPTGMIPASQPTWVNITPGLGTSKFTPFRLFCPPKAHLLELSDAD